MTFSISVKGDIKAVTRDLNKVQRKIVPQATATALNKTVNKVRTASVRETSQTKGITPQKLVRRRFTVRRATRRNLVARLRVRTHGIRLVDLGNPRETKTGVKVKRHTVPGGFVAEGIGGRSVFKRKGAPRLPIKEQRIALSPDIERITEKNIRIISKRDFKRIFENEIRFRLRRRGL